MKQILFSFIFLFSLSFSTQAQDAAAPLETESTSEQIDSLEHSLLWEISGKDLKTPSYLYGTIHIIGKDDFFLTDNTKKAIDDTERMTFEINMEDMTNMSALMSMMMNAFMKDGQSLKKLLNEEDYALVDDKFKELGLPLMMFDRIKPMFTSMMTQMDMSGGNPMTDDGGSTGYEMEFMSMAQEREMEMAGLETMEFQMSMFDSIPYEAQAQMLVDGIKAEAEGSEQANEMDIMIKAYKEQNLNALDAYINSAEGGMGDFTDLLLVRRNQNWIPEMAKQMAEKPTFFAVGAGHLAGEQGVIQLLRDAGYTLSPAY